MPGLRATNPFYSRKKVSLRARNLNGDRLKVNDKRGNPIEIAAVVVWHVDDTAKAAFDVDDYENFVKVQSEAAVRHLASSFAYDAEILPDTAREPTLLESADIVARALEKELQARLEQAGVVVEEARLMHLAYAPEIAQVMLRRQQAEAIIAARQKIVHGAVSMVEMALHELSVKQVVDARRRAQGGDGVEPHDGAVRRVGRAAGHQHRHAVHVRRSPWASFARLLFVLELVVAPIVVWATSASLPAARGVALRPRRLRQRLDEPRRLCRVHARAHDDRAAGRGADDGLRAAVRDLALRDHEPRLLALAAAARGDDELARRRTRAGWAC